MMMNHTCVLRLTGSSHEFLATLAATSPHPGRKIFWFVAAGWDALCIHPVDAVTIVSSSHSTGSLLDKVKISFFLPV